MTTFLDKLKKGMNTNDISLEEKDEKDIEKEAEKNDEESNEEKLEEEKTKKVEEKTEENKLEKQTEKPPKKNREKKPLKPKAVKLPQKKEPSVKNIVLVNEAEKKDWFEQDGQLTVDVFETDKDIVVRSAVAGVKPEELDISVENDVLMIRGTRQKYAEEKAKNYFFQECYWGKFSREVVLPEEVDASKTQASMKNGILIIKIPKTNENEKNKIDIKED